MLDDLTGASTFEVSSHERQRLYVAPQLLQTSTGKLSRKFDAMDVDSEPNEQDTYTLAHDGTSATTVVHKKRKTVDFGTCLSSVPLPAPAPDTDPEETARLLQREAERAETLLFFPSDVRTDIQLNHESVIELTDEALSKSEIPLEKSKSPNPPVFLLTESTISQPADQYSVVSAYDNVISANSALLLRLRMGHLDVLARNPMLWEKSRTLTPSPGCIAWDFEKDGCLGMAVDEVPPDDVILRVRRIDVLR